MACEQTSVGRRVAASGLCRRRLSDDERARLRRAEDIVGRYLSSLVRPSRDRRSVDRQQEAAFVEVAGWYSRINGLTAPAWHSVGVDPAVLARAGI